MKIEVLSKEIVTEAKLDIRIQLENREEISKFRYVIENDVNEIRYSLERFGGFYDHSQLLMMQRLLEQIPKV